MSSINDPGYFDVQGIRANPTVFDWDEFLDLYVIEYNSWCAANARTTRENLDHFFQGFGKDTRHKWVIRLPLVRKPGPANVIPNTRDHIEQAASLGLVVRALLHASDEVFFGTDDPEVHDKLFILKLCFA